MKNAILTGQTALGLEFGSTRIKAVLINRDFKPIASGSYTWENHLENGIWTYHSHEIISGLQECMSKLFDDVEASYGIPLEMVGSIGISGMMHGYLPFDSDWNQLADFRTWRNTITGQAAEILSREFDFNVPQRWSISHLYQTMLNHEEHLDRIAHFTTLAGYITYLLCGENVLGIGEASGVFPIDSVECDYNSRMIHRFNELSRDLGYEYSIQELLPQVLVAGQVAGHLTEEGARLLDPRGILQAGCPIAPPEGDMGTGMVATNSIRVGTGNVSAGTSVNATIVADHELQVHREIDMITSPTGSPAALVHANNCTSDINAWVSLFSQVLGLAGAQVDMGDLYTMLFNEAAKGQDDCGGLMSFNYLSGEGITDINSGRPMFLRKPDANMELSDFMKTHLYSALATLKIGCDILTQEEDVKIEALYGHGGFFKTPEVGQQILADAMKCPVFCLETAGEGGPFGMAILAAYLIWADGEPLEDFLEKEVFQQANITKMLPNPSGMEGFDRFISDYKRALVTEVCAVDNF